MDATMAAPSRRVDMWYDGTAAQNRWTVAFRLILVIPQAIVLIFLWIAAVVVAVIGWFGALFMGRLPEWAHTYISGVLRWGARVAAYGTLLTDVYPPFSFDDEAYPARPVLPSPGPLNRWAVLFRWLLVIPASTFSQIVARGLYIPLALVAWFVVLIRGEMPAPLYWAYASLVRYETRVNGYFLMLTSEYAWGMLGDPVAGPFAGPYPAAPPSTPPPPPPAAAARPAPTDAVEGAPPPPQWPPPVPPPAPPSGFGSMPPPSPWERAVPAAGAPVEPPGRGTLVLAGAARSWMIFAIVWGSVLTVAQGPIQAAITRHNTTQSASAGQDFTTASRDVAQSSNAVLAAASAAASCTSVAAIRPARDHAATQLTGLADDLRAMNLPDNANESAGAVESDADQLSAIFTQLGGASDCTTYHTVAAHTGAFATVLTSFPTDVAQLLTVLHADAS